MLGFVGSRRKCSCTDSAEINLTLPPVPNRPVQHEVTSKKECEAPQHTNSDGVSVNSKERQKLEIEVSLGSGKTFRLGDRVRADIKMSNRGSEAIDIPWMTDSRASSRNSAAAEH
jgi:hypothetical protein